MGSQISRRRETFSILLRAGYGAPLVAWRRPATGFSSGFRPSSEMTKVCGPTARLKSRPCRSWRSQILEGWGCGIPCLAKDARPFDKLRAGSFGSAQGRLWGTPVAVASAYSRFLTGLSARFGMTRFFGVCGTTEPVRRYGTQRTSGAEAAVFLVILDAGLEGLLHPRL
jgi:hypothetical protein